MVMEKGLKPNYLVTTITPLHVMQIIYNCLSYLLPAGKLYRRYFGRQLGSNAPCTVHCTLPPSCRYAMWFHHSKSNGNVTLNLRHGCVIRATRTARCTVIITCVEIIVRVECKWVQASLMSNGSRMVWNDSTVMIPYVME